MFIEAQMGRVHMGRELHQGTVLPEASPASGPEYCSELFNLLPSEGESSLVDREGTPPGAGNGVDPISKGVSTTPDPLRILLLAPQPFYQERGTPIAVRALLESVVATLPEAQFLVLAYHEGEDVAIPRVRLERVWVPRVMQRFLCGIKPGASLKKLACDVLFAAKTFAIVIRERLSGRPIRLVHAVEESVFIAWVLRLFWGIPYVYDMDSLLAEQLVQRWPFLSPLQRCLSLLEHKAVAASTQVFAVCDSIAEQVTQFTTHPPVVLRDFSLLTTEGIGTSAQEDIRRTCGLEKNTTVVLYVGNLEHYQGVELLLEAFLLLPPTSERVALVAIGGAEEQMRVLQGVADRRLGLHKLGDREAPSQGNSPRNGGAVEALSAGARVTDRAPEETAARAVNRSVHFLGARPVEQLGTILAQADILVSPRILGGNTPMKIYSYLDSGKAILATRIASHTQVLSDDVALLVAPEAQDMAAGLSRLLAEPDLRVPLGRNAERLARDKYHRSVFDAALSTAYRGVLQRIAARG